MVMPFGFGDTHTTLQREINRILPPRFGLELGIEIDVHIDEANGMVGVPISMIYYSLLKNRSKNTITRSSRLVSYFRTVTRVSKSTSVFSIPPKPHFRDLWSAAEDYV
jgi:hypothetical protein